MFNTAHPAFPYQPPSPNGLEGTAQMFQSQVDLLGEKLAADPGNDALRQAWMYAMDKLAAMVPHQTEVALAREETARHNDTEWTARNQSTNLANVQITQSYNFSLLEHNRSAFQAQTHQFNGHQAVQFVQSLGQYPQVASSLLSGMQPRLN